MRTDCGFCDFGILVAPLWGKAGAGGATELLDKAAPQLLEKSAGNLPDPSPISVVERQRLPPFPLQLA